MAIVLEKKEKRWLKNVFFALTNSPKPSSNNWNTDDFNQANSNKLYTTNADNAWQAAANIMEELDKRRYKDIDQDIRTLVNTTSYFDKSTDKYDSMSFDEAAAAIAAMCAINNIIWDPSKYTTYEVDYFYRTTFGKWLKQATEAHNDNSSAQQTQSAQTQQSTQSTKAQPAPAQQSQATVSAQPTQTKKPVTVQGTSPTGPHAGITTAGNYIKPNSVHSRSVLQKNPGPPANTYKSSGPRSKDAFDLKSVPGQKMTMTGDQDYLFVITAKDSTTSKNRPLVYVNPLIDTPKYRVNGTNKIKFDSAHGYSDLVLYFNTPTDADAFMQKVIANKMVPSKLTDVEVGKQSMTKMDKYFSHGFYKIGTELGDAMVCAYKLNEELTPESAAELEEAMLVEPVEKEQPKTADEYKEAVRQLTRNHTWD